MKEGMFGMGFHWWRLVTEFEILSSIQGVV